MIILHGHPMSTCTRKVLMTLAETETPFEMKVVDLGTGGHKQEAHLRHQPFGRIPAIEDGGFELFESRAICRYISEKTGGKLIPRDLQARAKMEQWISVETSEFTPHAMKFIYHHVFKRAQEPAVLEAAGTALNATCGVLDKQLAKTPMLAGAEFSIADICYMPYVEYAIGTPAKDIFAKHPHLMAWWQKVGERATWRKAIAKA
jgi:glutathione S-transferase